METGVCATAHLLTEMNQVSLSREIIKNTSGMQDYSPTGHSDLGVGKL